jgi:hypothetical protein
MNVPSFSMKSAHASRQRGVVLFFALVALVAMSLAAVALIRSVDTSTLIAGNLAFKQSATTGGDAGIDAAITWLDNLGMANSHKSILGDSSHPFNITNLAARPGYFSSIDPGMNLFDDGTWNSADNKNMLVGTNLATGNITRVVIQRMCRIANTAAQDAECLFGGVYEPKDENDIKTYADICDTEGCYVPGQSPQVRITARTQGPRGTVSYVQAFVY